MSTLPEGVDAILARRSEIDSALRKQKSPVTIMFTDLVGSTSFFERHGDTAGVTWLEEHHRIVVPLVQAHAGVVVKTIGDSVLAQFGEPLKAIRAAIEIQKQMMQVNAGRDAASQMGLRIALHHGLAYLRGSDVFGDVVNVAAHLAKASHAYQILVSEPVYQLARDSEVTFRPLGALQVHGRSQAENSYEVLWTDEKTYAQLSGTSVPHLTSSTGSAAPGGRYQILSEIGHGGMGVVYRAYDAHIGRVVAIKTIAVEADPENRGHYLERLKLEARMAGQLDHPNIVTVHDVGEEAGLFFFTMQYLEGKTLEQLRKQKQLPPMAERFKIADQICTALAYAHQAGIIHRDLKPSNVMLTDSGVVKVLDFGIAKVGDFGLTKVGTVLGTPGFMSPEQALGKKIDNRADIFALGSLIYELFTGERAFSGENTAAILYRIIYQEPVSPSVLDPSIPAGFDAVIAKALAKDPDERYQTAEELRHGLRGCETGINPVAAIRAAAPEERTPPKPIPIDRTRVQTSEKLVPVPAPRAIKLDKTMVIGAAVGIVMVLAAVIGGILMLTRPKQAETQPAAKPAAPASTTTASPPADRTTQSPPADPQAAAQALEKANRLWQDGKGDAAVDVLQSFLRTRPEEAGVRIRYGQMLAMQQKFPDALHQYEIVLKFDPKNINARIGIAKITSWNNDLPLALKLYDAILADAPKNYDARVGKAFTLMWMKRTDEARKLFQAAHKQAPNDAEVTAALNKLSGR